MDPTRLRLKGSSPEVLKAFIDHLSSNYMDILFKHDTGVISVVQPVGGGDPQIAMFKNGLPHERIKFIGPKKFSDPGPFMLVRNGVQVRYLRLDGARVEYVGTKVTRVVAANGQDIPFDPANELWKTKIKPNQHHAEAKLDLWRKVNQHEVVTASPTRGMCKDCFKDYRQEYGERLDNIVPKHRQTKAAFRNSKRDWDQMVKRIKAEERAGLRAPQEFVLKSGAPTEIVPLAKEAQLELNRLRLPNQKLLRISKYLKIAGPIMLAFDAATSAAQAAEQWKKGAKRAAADTLAEFAGRTVGALAGAEALGLMGAGFGSIVPGLGTTVGAIVGGIVGGIAGAALGEQGAKELCHQIMDWAQSHAPGHDPEAGATSPTPARGAPQRYNNPAVQELQEEMYRAGYGDAEVSLVCGGILSRPGERRTVQEVFGQLASHITSGDADEPHLASYPLVNAFDEHVRQDRDTTRTVGNETLPLPPSAPPLPRSDDRLHDQHGLPNTTHVPRPHDPPVVPPHSLPLRPHVTEEVVGRLIEPSPNTGESTLDRGMGVENIITSNRVDVLTQRLTSYVDDRAGPAETAAREADLSELKQLLAQRTGSSADLAETMRHTALINRTQQDLDFAKRDELEKDHLTRKLADDKRAREEEALRTRSRVEASDRSKIDASVEELERKRRKNLEDDKARALHDAERKRDEEIRVQRLEAERAQRAAETEAQRLEAERARRAAETEAQRLEAERARRAAETEAQRLEADRARRAAETGTQRIEAGTTRREEELGTQKLEADKTRREEELGTQKLEADKTRREEELRTQKLEADKTRREEELRTQKLEADKTRREEELKAQKLEADKTRREEELKAQKIKADEALRDEGAKSQRNPEGAAGRSSNTRYETRVEAHLIKGGSRAAEDAALQKQREAELKAQRDADQARLAADQERQRREAELKAQRDADRARLAADQERERREADLKGQRDADKARAAADQERQRREAEAKTQREAEQARLAAEQERQRREAELRAQRAAEQARLAAEQERQRREAELRAQRAAEQERQRREAELKAQRDSQQARIAAEQARLAAERERQRREAELKAQRDAERARIAAEQERQRREAEWARHLREAERARIEAERERQRRDAEQRAAERERQRREAESARQQREAERARIEAERERQRRDAELRAAERERQRREAEYIRQQRAAEKARLEAERYRKRLEAEWRRQQKETERARQEQERAAKQRERDQRKWQQDQRRQTFNVSGKIMGRGPRRVY